MVAYSDFNFHFPKGKQCEHLFMCLFSIPIASLMKYLFNDSVYFLGGLLACLLLSAERLLYGRMLAICVVWDLQISSPGC